MSDLDISEIKDLARRFTPEEIEGCITDQLERGKNVCIRNESTEKIINELVKAKFVREMMERGYSLADALRELARRIRQVQSFATKS